MFAMGARHKQKLQISSIEAPKCHYIAVAEGFADTLLLVKTVVRLAG
jgi:hypothetical protein